MHVESLIRTYPKVRPPLSDELTKIYVKTYQDSRGGKGVIYKITQYLESWMHKKIASVKHGNSILEIGAGTLNQVPYELNYSVYDVIEPFGELLTNNPLLTKINRVYADISQIDSATHRYDRIISVAALEHLTHLPQSLARSGLLLAKDGIFQAGIPSEGGFIWGATWRCSVGLSFRVRTGLDYGELMRHEHVNDALEIIQLIHYFFDQVEVTWFPLPHRHLSLYGYIEARNPNLERCRAHA